MLGGSGKEHKFDQRNKVFYHAAVFTHKIFHSSFVSSSVLFEIKSVFGG